MRPHRSLSLDAAAAAAALSQLHTHSKKSKKSKRGSYKSWSKDDLLLAVAAVRSAKNSPHHLSFEKAERKYHVPHSTLHDYMQKTSAAIASAPRGSRPSDIIDNVVSTTRSGTPRTLLDSDTEQQLLTWVFKMDEMCIPVDLDQLRYKAMRLHLCANNIPITAENEHIFASKHWWRRLKNRHPELALRTPQKIEYLRLRATQPEIIRHFYQLLKHALDTYHFTQEEIWAADETGVDDNGRCKKVIALKGTNTHTRRQDPRKILHGTRIFCVTEYFMFSHRKTRCENQGVWISSTHIHYAHLLCQWENNPSPFCI